MKNIMYCRRTFIAVLAIGCLAAMAFAKGMDTAMALASVAIGLAASNSYENANKKKSIVE